ncbi:MAG: ABC transporter permease [Spirochaetota bacterium]|nr:ABC transporter permease [Spirochaetota bacterium]
MIISTTNRIVRLLFILLGAVLIVHSLLYIIPGDPAMMIAGEYASQDDIDEIRRELSLNESFWVKYFKYIERLCTLNLGRSLHSDIPVDKLIFDRFPATLILAFTSMIIAAVLGIVFGAISAINKGRFLDRASLWISSILISTPIFVSCIVLSLTFSYYFNLLPPSGRDGLNPSYIILPSLALASRSLALLVRIVRNELIYVLNQDYIRTVRSLGFHEAKVIFLFAFKNILAPVLTIILLDFGTYLGGAVVTESVFSWPGIGRLLIVALYKRDIPVIQGVIIFSTLLFLIIGLIIDLMQGIIVKKVE